LAESILIQTEAVVVRPWLTEGFLAIVETSASHSGFQARILAEESPWASKLDIPARP